MPEGYIRSTRQDRRQYASSPKPAAAALWECQACGWDTELAGERPRRCPKCGASAFEALPPRGDAPGR